MGDIDEGKRWKDAGDALYKTGDFHRAACCYDNALLVLTPNAPEMAACFKNRAACHLKLKQFRNVIDDCTRGQCRSENGARRPLLGLLPYH